MSRLKKQSKRGMTLVEVVISLAMMVLLFAAFAVCMQGASALNRRTIELDERLAYADEDIIVGSQSNATVQFTIDGTVYSDVAVKVYIGTDEDYNQLLVRFD